LEDVTLFESYHTQLERALRLAPSDSDISGNLQLVKKENGLFPKEASFTEQFFRVLSHNQWTALIPVSLILLIVFMLAATRYRFSRQLNLGVSVGCFLLLGVAIAGTLFRYQHFNPSVVVSPDAKLFISPFESSATIGAVREVDWSIRKKATAISAMLPMKPTGKVGFLPQSLNPSVQRYQTRYKIIFV
jgi:hypothetical protein